MLNSPTDRRTFVATLTGGTAALLSAAGCASPLVGGMPGGSSSPTPLRSAKWDDGWTTRLGRHRTVFDVADLEAQPGVGQIAPVMDAYNEVLGTSDKDLGFVLVIRHFAIPMALSDAMWAKYDVGADLKRKDPATKESYKRNPFTTLITSVQARGVTVLGCHSAAIGLAGLLAQRAKADAATVREEVLRGLLPGVILLPNGLYALARAQDVGCGFMR
jgi:hypothetical protein